MLNESIKLKLNKFISEGKAKELLSDIIDQIEKEDETDDFGIFGHSLSSYQVSKMNMHFEKSKKSESVGTYLKKLTTGRGIYSVSDETFGVASIPKAYWSKLSNDKIDKHDKDKLLRISIFLKLNLKEAMNLLQKAGFTLCEENSKDNIIIFCIKEGIYDLHDVEELLEERNLRSLFSNIRTLNTK